MPADLGFQLDLSLRLLIAAILGAAIGLEREIHEHPAGMRTHLLVSLGSALFTVLSATGFGALLEAGQATNVDPTRIAAQIVSGIGFLGAGAILKYGTTIRGLTTAASLWVTASVGMAVGAGEHVLGVVGTVIAIVSLWPLNLVVDRLRIGRERIVRVRLMLRQLELLGPVSDQLALRRTEIAGIQMQRQSPDRYEVELELRLGTGETAQGILETLGSIDGVDVLETSREAE
ncbi:MAG TPA: MgtC/SapB family protein [Candidatus Limnocylindrales bacterium]|nr:MgtC/SapB family protein [Candidatus Limnocylindrales bacterium]